MSTRWGSATVACATALAAATLLLVPADLTWARVLVGVPFVLFLPGSAVMFVFDPDRRLGRLAWLALSVAASVVVAMFAGIALAASVGLTAERAVAALTVVTLIAIAFDWTRSRPRPESLSEWRGVAGDVAGGALAVLACALVVMALSIPRDTTTGPGTTQLWALPDSSGGLSVGVRNVDAASERYLLTIEQGGRMITQQRVDMPKGTEALFEVKRSAALTLSAPVIAVLSDESGIVAPRTVRTWTTP